MGGRADNDCISLWGELFLYLFIYFFVDERSCRVTEVSETASSYCAVFCKLCNIIYIYFLLFTLFHSLLRLIITIALLRRNKLLQEPPLFFSPRRCKTGASSSSPRAVSRCLSFPPATHLDHSNLLHYSPTSAQSDLWQLWPLEPRPSSPSTTSLLLAPEPFQPGRYFNTQQHQSVSFLGNQQ